MGKRDWAGLGLVIGFLQIAHAQTGDQFNAGTSKQDCFQRVQAAKYKAQAQAQAEDSNAVRICLAQGGGPKSPCVDAAHLQQRAAVRQMNEAEATGTLQCRDGQPPGGYRYNPPLEAQIPQFDPAGEPGAQVTPTPPQVKRNPDGSFVLGDTRTGLNTGAGVGVGGPSYPAPKKLTAREDWRVGDANGTRIFIDVGQATIGVATNVILPQVKNQPNSPWASAHGTFDGQEFVVDSLSDYSNRSVPQNPPLRIGQRTNRP